MRLDLICRFISLTSVILSPSGKERGIIHETVIIPEALPIKILARWPDFFLKIRYIPNLASFKPIKLIDDCMTIIIKCIRKWQRSCVILWSAKVSARLKLLAGDDLVPYRSSKTCSRFISKLQTGEKRPESQKCISQLVTKRNVIGQRLKIKTKHLSS